jgi:nucleoid DNA-binding protein
MAKAAKQGAKKSGKKTMTKSQFIAHLAEKTQLTKKQVDAVLNEVVSTITDQLKGAGKFVFPGLARMTRVFVPEKPGGEKKINPLTKTEYITKKKDAHYKVNIRPIKAMKTSLM